MERGVLGLGGRGDGDHPREVAKAALAHKVCNPIEAAYRRTDLLERRRRLMDDWAGVSVGPESRTSV